jgi:hypothetical protein
LFRFRRWASSHLIARADHLINCHEAKTPRALARRGDRAEQPIHRNHEVWPSMAWTENVPRSNDRVRNATLAQLRFDVWFRGPDRSHVGDDRFRPGWHFVLRACPNDCPNAVSPRDEFWNEASSDVASSSGQEDGGTHHRGLGVRGNRRLIWNEGGVNDC